MKKLISISLIIILICTVAIVPVSANYGEKTMHTLEQAMEYWEDFYGEEIQTKTLYFYFRDDWKYESNDYYDATVGLDSCKPAIYWYGGTCCIEEYPPYIGRNSWPGYILTDEVAPNVYRAEVPVSVPTIIFNNGIDGGQDKTKPINQEAKQMRDTCTNGIDGADRFGFYPEGISEDNFDNMIYVTNNNNHNNNWTTEYHCSWFYYYGNGEYGTAPTREEALIIYSDGAFPLNEEDNADIMRMNIGDEKTIKFKISKNASVVSENFDVVNVVSNEDNTEYTLKATGVGETKITVISDIISDLNSNKITFSAVVENPEFENNLIKISAGESVIPTFKNLYSDDYVLTSSNPDVAMVKNGVVYGLSKGNTTLTATAGDVTIDCKIKVKNNPKIVNKQCEKVKTVTIRKGKKITLKLQGKVKGIKNLYTNSPKVKIISKKNTDKIKIKGLKKGTSKVYVTVNNVKKIPIKVKVR